MAARASRRQPAAADTSAERNHEDRGGSSARLETVASYAAESGRGPEDRLIYERVRLGILSALCVNPSMTFSELKKLLDTSDGNLSVHARKLEEAGLIQCTKSFEARRPKTEYRIETKGRRALDRYLNHMEKLIDATRS